MPVATAQPSPYRLADHVRACCVDGQVVILDMQRDKYMGLGGAQLSALCHFVVDWPMRSDVSQSAAPSTETNRCLKALLDQQILAGTGTPIPPAGLEQAQETLSFDLGSTDAPSTWRDALDLGQAAFVVAVWMRFRCLAEIADSVAHLRPQIHARHRSSSPVDLHAAASAYMRLRPFVLTAHDQCLRDSLTLIRFLAKKNVFPRWVVGVRTRPFAAHSWVQEGPLVLNDVHEHVREYTPILVV